MDGFLYDNGLRHEIVNNSYRPGFCMDGRSVESMRLNGYICRIWINEVLIASLFNIFVNFDNCFC